MNIQRCISGFRFGSPRAIQTTQLWREMWSWQLSILAFDIDLFFCGNPVLLNWKTALKSEWGPISMLISADMVRMVAREKGLSRNQSGQ